MNFIHSLALQIKNSLRDLLPVVLVMSFFQTLVIQQPLPDTLALSI